MVGGKRDLPYAGTCTQSSSASFASSGVVMWLCRVGKSGSAKIKIEEMRRYENHLFFLVLFFFPVGTSSSSDTSWLSERRALCPTVWANS